jgi:hypothetical protein
MMVEEEKSKRRKIEKLEMAGRRRKRANEE